MSAEVHAVMYRDYKMGTLCDSLAWGPPTKASAVTADVTCPSCQHKLEGSRAGSSAYGGPLVIEPVGEQRGTVLTVREVAK